MKWTTIVDPHHHIGDIHVQLTGMSINDDAEASATLRVIENDLISVYELDLLMLIIRRSDNKAEFVYGNHVVAIMAHLGELRDVAEEKFDCSFSAEREQ